MAGPQILSITRTTGVAGQVAYTATVQYPDEPRESVTFVGSAFGAPVVMVSPSGAQTFVRHYERFGPFGPEWVRRFFA